MEKEMKLTEKKSRRRRKGRTERKGRRRKRRSDAVLAL